MKVKLYTTHCPKCKMLELKLKQKNIEFEEHDNVEEFAALGFKAAPMLDINGKILSFSEAMKYISENY